MTTSALWYYHQQGRGFGPMQETDIGGLLARKEIAADTPVWRDGLSNWTEAQSTELSGFLSHVPRAPTVPIVPRSQRRKHSKLYWQLFTMAELFNFLILGIPLISALVLWR
jgi:GYF domain 2